MYNSLRKIKVVCQHIPVKSRYWYISITCINNTHVHGYVYIYTHSIIRPSIIVLWLS